MTPNPLRPFIPLFGSKWRIAPTYPEPRYDTIIEPFAGGAGYALHYPSLNVRLYDMDPVVCGIWDYLIRGKASEVRRLPARCDHVDDIKGPPEARWLVGWWFNKGVTRPRKRPGAWARNWSHRGHRQTSHWGEQVRDRIADQMQHIRHWRVYNAPYTAAGEQMATWFIDPPYHGPVGRRYAHHAIKYHLLSYWCCNRLDRSSFARARGPTGYRSART